MPIGLIVTEFAPPSCPLMLFLLLYDITSCRTREILLSLPPSRWLYHALYLILFLIGSGSSRFGFSLSLILPSQTAGHFHQDSRTCFFSFLTVDDLAKPNGGAFSPRLKDAPFCSVFWFGSFSVSVWQPWGLGNLSCLAFQDWFLYRRSYGGLTFGSLGTQGSPFQNYQDQYHNCFYTIKQYLN